MASDAKKNNNNNAVFTAKIITEKGSNYNIILSIHSKRKENLRCMKRLMRFTLMSMFII